MSSNPYYIAIIRYVPGNDIIPDLKIIYIGSVSKEEMPYGMERGVSSDGDLIYSYATYRNTLLFRWDVNKLLDTDQIPPDRISALPSDTVVAYDVPKFIKKKKKSNLSLCDEKVINMYKNGELEWFGEIEERNRKIDNILSDKS